MLELCLDEPLWHGVRSEKAFLIFFFFGEKHCLEHQKELLYKDELNPQISDLKHK